MKNINLEKLLKIYQDYLINLSFKDFQVKSFEDTNFWHDFIHDIVNNPEKIRKTLSINQFNDLYEILEINPNEFHSDDQLSYLKDIHAFDNKWAVPNFSLKDLIENFTILAFLHKVGFDYPRYSLEELSTTKVKDFQIDLLVNHDTTKWDLYQFCQNIPGYDWRIFPAVGVEESERILLDSLENNIIIPQLLKTLKNFDANQLVNIKDTYPNAFETIINKHSKHLNLYDENLVHLVLTHFDFKTELFKFPPINAQKHKGLLLDFLGKRKDITENLDGKIPFDFSQHLLPLELLEYFDYVSPNLFEKDYFSENKEKIINILSSRKCHISHHVYDLENTDKNVLKSIFHIDRFFNELFIQMQESYNLANRRLSQNIIEAYQEVLKEKCEDIFESIHFSLNEKKFRNNPLKNPSFKNLDASFHSSRDFNHEHLMISSNHSYQQSIDTVNHLLEQIEQLLNSKIVNNDLWYLDNFHQKIIDEMLPFGNIHILVDLTFIIKNHFSNPHDKLLNTQTSINSYNLYDKFIHYPNEIAQYFSQLYLLNPKDANIQFIHDHIDQLLCLSPLSLHQLFHGPVETNCIAPYEFIHTFYDFHERKMNKILEGFKELDSFILNEAQESKLREIYDSFKTFVYKPISQHYQIPSNHLINDISYPPFHEYETLNQKHMLEKIQSYFPDYNKNLPIAKNNHMISSFKNTIDSQTTELNDKSINVPHENQNLIELKIANIEFISDTPNSIGYVFNLKELTSQDIAALKNKDFHTLIHKIDFELLNHMFERELGNETFYKKLFSDIITDKCIHSQKDIFVHQKYHLMLNFINHFTNDSEHQFIDDFIKHHHSLFKNYQSTKKLNVESSLNTPFIEMSKDFSIQPIIFDDMTQNKNFIHEFLIKVYKIDKSLNNSENFAFNYLLRHHIDIDKVYEEIFNETLNCLELHQLKKNIELLEEAQQLKVLGNLFEHKFLTFIDLCIEYNHSTDNISINDFISTLSEEKLLHMLSENALSVDFLNYCIEQNIKLNIHSEQATFTFFDTCFLHELAFSSYKNIFKILPPSSNELLKDKLIEEHATQMINLLHRNRHEHFFEKDLSAKQQINLLKILKENNDFTNLINTSIAQSMNLSFVHQASDLKSIEQYTSDSYIEYFMFMSYAFKISQDKQLHFECDTEVFKKQFNLENQQDNRHIKAGALIFESLNHEKFLQGFYSFLTSHIDHQFKIDFMKTVLPLWELNVAEHSPIHLFSPQEEMNIISTLLENQPSIFFNSLSILHQDYEQRLSYAKNVLNEEKCLELLTHMENFYGFGSNKNMDVLQIMIDNNKENPVMIRKIRHLLIEKEHVGVNFLESHQMQLLMQTTQNLIEEKKINMIINLPDESNMIKKKRKI